METKQPTLKSLIKKNKFDWINPVITSENFPPQGNTGTVLNNKVKIFHFNETLSTEAVLRRLDDQGFRSATVYELLTWSQKSWNGKDFVVALGSVWQRAPGHRRVACLYEGASRRPRYLFWDGLDWLEVCRFAAVKKG